MRIALAAVVIAALVGGVVGLYLYNKPASRTASGDADISVNAVQLMNDYQQDEETANAAYLGKVVEVRGTVSSIGKSGDEWNILLATDDLLGTIKCALPAEDNSGVSRVTAGQEILVKGECTGFLTDVVLDKCVLIEIL